MMIRPPGVGADPPVVLGIKRSTRFGLKLLAIEVDN